MKLISLIEEFSETIKSDISNEVEIFRFTNNSELKTVSKKSFNPKQANYTGWLRGLFLVNSITKLSTQFFFWESDEALHKHVLDSFKSKNKFQKEIIIAVELKPTLTFPPEQAEWKNKNYRLTNDYTGYTSGQMFKYYNKNKKIYENLKEKEKWNKELEQIMKYINSKYTFNIVIND